MYTIVVNHQHELVATHSESIMQKSKMINKLRFLVDKYFDGIDMSEFTVYMEYKLPVSGQYCSEILEPSEELYKDVFLEYILPFDTNLTAEAGDVEVQLTFVQVIVNEDGTNEQIVRKTNTISIKILPIAAWSDIIPDCALTAVDQRLLKVEAMLEALEQYDGDIDTEPGPDEDNPDNEPEPEDGSTAYAYSEEGVIAAFNDSDVETIILENDIILESANGLLLDNGAEKTINLNGCNLIGVCNDPDAHSNVFYVANGTLTIEGDGYVYGGTGSYSNVAVRSAGENSKVIINGGSYNTDVDYEGGYSDVIYGTDHGAIEIYGGHFDNNSRAEYIGPTRYVLNVKNNGGATITCYGGEYVNQNPADGDDKDTETGYTFLGDGCYVTEREEDGLTIYTVNRYEDN